MKSIPHILGKKSPLKILLFIALLLTALVFFEITAKRIRQQALVITINGEAPEFSQGHLAENIFQGELLPIEINPILHQWYQENNSLSQEDLRREWESFKVQHPQDISSPGFQLFEVKMLLWEGKNTQALECLTNNPLPDHDDYILYLAIVQSRTGKIQESISSYQQCINRNPRAFLPQFNLAVLYYNQNRFEAAKEGFKKAIPLSSGSRRARSYRLMGECLLALEQWQEGEKALEESILLEPAAIEPRLLLADLYLKHHQKSRMAWEIYQEVSRLDDKNPELYLGMAQWYQYDNDWEGALGILQEGMEKGAYSLPLYIEMGRLLMEKEEPERAMQILQQGLVSYPNDPGILFQLGRAQYHQGRFDEAEILFSNAKDQSSRPSMELLNNLGLCLHAQGKDDQAIATFHQALSIYPMYTSAAYNLGLIHMDREEFQKAREYFLGVIELDPSHLDSWYNLGISYRQLGSLMESISAYEKAITLDPSHEKSRLNLAVSYNRVGNQEKAREQYEILLELNPRYAHGWNNLGLLQKAEGDWSDAELSYKKALELDPLEPSYWLNLSALLGSQERREEAVALLIDALEIHPQSAEIRYNLALQYKGMNQTEQAIDELERAVLLNPTYHRAWKSLGDSFADRNRHEEAIEAYRIAYSLGEDPYLHYLIGKSLFSLGSFTEAAESIDQALENIKDNGYIWFNGGKTYQQLGDIQTSQEYFVQALQLTPHLSRVVSQQMESEEGAEDLFRAYLEKEPDNPFWMIQLVRHLILQDRWEIALEELNSSARYFSTNQEWMYLRAEVLEELKDNQQAQQQYQTILELFPRELTPYLRISEILMDHSEWERALIFVEEGLKEHPHERALIRIQGELYYKLEAYSLAQLSYESLIEQDPTHGKDWLALGKAHYQQDHYTSAEEAFRQSLVLLPQYNWVHIWLGRSLRKQERYLDAEEQFWMAIEMEDQEAVAWVSLGDLYREEERRQEAYEAYSKALEIRPTNGSYQRRLESVSP